MHVGRQKQNGILGQIVPALLKPFFKTPKQGAETTIHVALKPGLNVTGKYFVNCKIAKPKPWAEDEDLAQELWARSERLVSLR